MLKRHRNRSLVLLLASFSILLFGCGVTITSKVTLLATPAGSAGDTGPLVLKNRFDPESNTTPAPSPPCSGTHCVANGGVSEGLTVAVQGTITLNPTEITIPLTEQQPPKCTTDDDSDDHSTSKGDDDRGGDDSKSKGDDHSKSNDDGHKSKSDSKQKGDPPKAGASKPDNNGVGHSKSSSDDHGRPDSDDHSTSKGNSGDDHSGDDDNHCGSCPSSDDHGKPDSDDHCSAPCNDHDSDDNGHPNGDDHCSGGSSGSGSSAKTWTGSFGPVQVFDNRGSMAGWTVYLALDDFAGTPESGATITPGVPKSSFGAPTPPDPPQQPPFHICDDAGCVGILMAAKPGTGVLGWQVYGTVMVKSNTVHTAEGQPVLDIDLSLSRHFDKS